MQTEIDFKKTIVFYFYYIYRKVHVGMILFLWRLPNCFGLNTNIYRIYKTILE